MLKELIADEVIEPEVTGMFRASQVGMCPTYLCHQMLGHPTLPMPGRVKHLLDDGRTHELDIVTRLVNKGIEVQHSCLDGQAEVCCLARPYVIGHPDGVIRVPKPGVVLDYADTNFRLSKFALLEITAPNHFTFLRLQKQHLLEALYVKYVQVQMYLCALEVKTYSNNAVVVVKNKNTSALYEEGVSFNLEIVAREITKLRHVEALVAKKQVDEYRCDDWRRNTCRYRQLCFAEEEASLTPVSGDVLKGETLKEAELLAELADVWRRGKDMKEDGDEMVQDAREQFRAIIEDYGCRGITVQGVSAMMVAEGITKSCNYALLEQEYPEVYKEVVDKKPRARYVRVS
jgi:hypothetical protein